MLPGKIGSKKNHASAVEIGFNFSHMHIAEEISCMQTDRVTSLSL